MEAAKRRELQDNNLRVWSGEAGIFPVQSSQDASLKKNTAFIKRLRTAISLPNVSTFIQEVGSLSLHKYLSELISACYDGLLRLKTPADVAAGVEIVSALHQRFGTAEFTAYLGWMIGRGLSTPDKAQLKLLAADVREREEKDRLARQRILLRIATELWLAGVLRSLDDVARPESETKGRDGKPIEPSGKAKSASAGSRQNSGHDPFPLEVLKDLLGHDREHANLPLVVLFVKTFAWEVLGIQARGQKKLSLETEQLPIDKNEDGSLSENSSAEAEPPLLSDELHQRFRNVLVRYFEDVKSRIIRDQKTISSQGRRNAEAYVRSGEVFEDRQASFERQTKAQEKLIASAQVLADVLGVDMPDLKEKEGLQSSSDGLIGLVKTTDYLKGSDDAGIWSDEEERRFYEGVMDLKERVPGILLDDGKKKKIDGESELPKKPTNGSEMEELAGDSDASTADRTITITNKSIGAQVDGLLARLPELHGKDGVDQFAIDFCFVNSKASRNRLIKALLDIPKGRTDLLSLYARIIATLCRYMPDIIAAVIAHLDEEFRSLQRRKSKEFLGAVRLQNVRYFAELTKFGVVPEHVIFHCFKVCLDDLNRVNVEILGNLMENCGRFLLRNESTSPRMSTFLEVLQRKKSAQHLEQRERLTLENAIYYVNPPERPAIEQKERSPLELYVHKLVYDDMSKRNVERITKQIRKLHWEESEVVDILEKVFTKPWKIKYNNVHLLAVILGSLHRYHSQFAVTCIDELLEHITHGLEFNDTKFNQRRIAQVKYLGELYVYRMVDSTVIFDTMYKIVTFGHDGGTPRPDIENVWDAFDDFFRIRLICILLETCGGFFDKGPVKVKLDFFIAFFQYYINTKDKLTPDIEFAILDAFAAISPSLRMITDLDEASQQFSEAVKDNYTSQIEDSTAEQEEVEEEFLSDGEDDDRNGIDEDKSSADENEAGELVNDSDTTASSEDDDEHIVVTRQEELRDPALDADFDRELAKLMSDSMDARKLERKTLFDVPLPLRRKERDLHADEGSDVEVTMATEEPSRIKFSLLSKRGNKQQTRDIDLPANSTFAVAMRNQQQAERLEQKRIKDIVLNLDLRDDNEGTDGEDPFSYLLRPNENYCNALTSHGRNATIDSSAFSHSSPESGGKVCNRRAVTAALSQGSRGTSSRRARHASSASPLVKITPMDATAGPATRAASAEPIQSAMQANALRASSLRSKRTMDKQPPNPYLQSRVDKAGKGRANQRGRQLQVSDLDWT